MYQFEIIRMTGNQLATTVASRVYASTPRLALEKFLEEDTAQRIRLMAVGDRFLVMARHTNHAHHTGEIFEIVEQPPLPAKLVVA